MKRSLKWRLLGWTAGGMLLLVATFAVLLYVMVQRALDRSFDSALAVTGRALAASVDLKNGRLELDDGDMPEFRRVKHADYYELWRADGSVVQRSASLGKNDLPSAGAAEGEPVFLAITLPDKRPGRAIVLVFRPKVEEKDEDGKVREGAAVPPAVLVVARETHPVDEQLESLRWQLAVAGGGSVLLILLVAAIVVRQGLRPLGTLAGQIATIRPDDLSTRFSSDRMPAEVAPVAARLNDLLARLDEAFHRERTLTADVAHELRTPLAGMRSTIEVAVSRPRSAQDQTQSLRDCLDIVRQTQAMTDNLLSLARIEGGQVAPQPQAVAPAEMVAALWRTQGPQAQARLITFTSLLPANLQCTVDRDLLAMALTNILANAAEYTNDGGRIEVSGRARNGAVELVFSNTGCTLTPEEVTHVFDRFWRGDSSRTATGVHCGLGLALVERAVRALGGTVTAEVAGGLFVIRLTVPASR